MFDPEKAIKKMLGPGINVPRYRQGKSMRDSDGDGINDIMDCQPKNMFRQDKIMTWAEFSRLHKGHEAPPEPGDRYAQTVSMSKGFRKDGLGEASCPKCGIVDQPVRDTGRIIEHKGYGEHIIIQRKNGSRFHTKNIHPIGCRTIFDITKDDKYWSKKPDLILKR